MSVHGDTLVTPAQPARVVSRRTTSLLSEAGIHLVLVAVLALMFVPIAWALSTSLKPYGDIFLYPPIWIPSPIQWQNYPDAMTYVPFPLYFRNSAIELSRYLLAHFRRGVKPACERRVLYNRHTVFDGLLPNPQSQVVLALRYY